MAAQKQTVMKIPVIQIVSLFLVLKLLANRRRQLYNSASLRRSPYKIIRVFGDLAGIDIVARFIQFSLIFVAGLYESNAKFKTTHTRLLIISNVRKLDHISNFFGVLRKITRYPRTIGEIKKIWAEIRIFPLPKKLNIRRILIMMEAAFQILGNFSNILFLFGDHYLGLYLAGIFTNKHHLIVADYWATFAWLLSGIFFLAKDLVMFFSHLKSKPKQRKNSKKFYTFLIIDVTKNILDTVSNLAFFYNGSFSKKSVGFLGAFSAFLYLSDYWRY